MLKDSLGFFRQSNKEDSRNLTSPLMLKKLSHLAGTSTIKLHDKVAALSQGSLHFAVFINLTPSAIKSF